MQCLKGLTLLTKQLRPRPGTSVPGPFYRRYTLKIAVKMYDGKDFIRNVAEYTEDHLMQYYGDGAMEQLEQKLEETCEMVGLLLDVLIDKHVLEEQDVRDIFQDDTIRLVE